MASLSQEPRANKRRSNGRRLWSLQPIEPRHLPSLRERSTEGEAVQPAIFAHRRVAYAAEPRQTKPMY